MLKRKRPRPRLNQFDRLFWIILRCSWSQWAEVLVAVKPETVVGWYRAGFSALLEVAIASPCWPTENYCRNSGTHPPTGRRECDLGSAQDPWRASETRLRYLRANRSSLSATSWAPRSLPQSLVDLPHESPGSDLCVRLLHHTHGDLPKCCIASSSLNTDVGRFCTST